MHGTEARTVNKMADLLIKGMEMPSECEFCPIAPTVLEAAP